MRPLRMSSGTTRFTTSTGIAKPMPAEAPEGEKIAVLTPMSRPAESSSGPPELPGLIGGVGLDHVGELAALARRQTPLQRADDAGGQRLVEAERDCRSHRRTARP